MLCAFDLYEVNLYENLIFCIWKFLYRKSNVFYMSKCRCQLYMLVNIHLSQWYWRLMLWIHKNKSIKLMLFISTTDINHGCLEVKQHSLLREFSDSFVLPSYSIRVLSVDWADVWYSVLSRKKSLLVVRYHSLWCLGGASLRNSMNFIGSLEKVSNL